MRHIWLMFKGMAMGIAEVIPGVSGGTIAFITGIYEELLATIQSMHPSAFARWRRDGFAAFWQHIHGPFLLFLLLGMAVGIGIGVFGVSHWLERTPEVLWGFFFGLIIASALYMAPQVERWNGKTIALLLLGIIVSYGITVISPAQGSDHLLAVFGAGMIAICALILPGISGSFILLLLGMYTIVIPAVKGLLSTPDTRYLAIVLVFGLGCVTGLAVFVRLLSWTFKAYRDETLAILIGFMLGSLNKIWPWRNPEVWLDKTSGTRITALSPIESGGDISNFRLLQEANVWPAAYHGNDRIVWVIAAVIVGLVAVFALGRLSKSEPPA